MENIEKKGLLTRIQDYLDTPKGRILLNYLYSWGAAIVILGALFKLTHIKGANLMLFIGMGTEVLVFFISGFERPYIPGDDSDDDESDGVRGRIIINGGATDGVVNIQAGGAAPAPAMSQPAPEISTTAAGGSPVNLEALEQSAGSYADHIAQLADSMEKMCRHADRMQQSAEELEQLTRNLISINTFYEMYLKSASSQMQNLECASNETQHMVEQIEELNRVYARMIEAMKVNSRMGNN